MLAVKGASLAAARSMSSVARGLVLGSGSNVVDLFYRIKALPEPGDKGYFSDPSILSDSVVGGETLRGP